METSTEVDRESTQPGLRAELFVTDVERSLAFYTGTLGFRLLRRSPSGYTSVRRDGVVLGLSSAAHLSPEHPSYPGVGEPLGRGVELVVMVSDVVAAHAFALNSGDSSVSALVEQPWGLTDFRVTDPDGFYIRVTGLSDRD